MQCDHSEVSINIDLIIGDWISMTSLIILLSISIGIGISISIWTWSTAATCWRTRAIDWSTDRNESWKFGKILKLLWLNCHWYETVTGNWENKWCWPQRRRRAACSWAPPRWTTPSTRPTHLGCPTWFQKSSGSFLKSTKSYLAWLYSSPYFATNLAASLLQKVFIKILSFKKVSSWSLWPSTWS